MAPRTALRKLNFSVSLFTTPADVSTNAFSTTGRRKREPAPSSYDHVPTDVSIAPVSSSESLALLAKRETQICMRNVGPIATIGGTYLQVGLRDQHNQSLPRMSKLPMREALDLHPSRPETAPADQPFLLRSVVPSEQCDLPLDHYRKHFAPHRRRS